MRTLSLFTAALLIFMTSVHAQQERYNKNNNVPQKSEEPQLINTDQPVRVNDLDGGGGGYNYTYYYGDPCGMYLNEEWQPGLVKLKEGGDMEGGFRYNLCVQKLEGIVEGDTFAFAKPEEIEYAIIGESKFIYLPYIREDRELSYSWFEVLCDGNCSLLLRRFIKFRKTDGDDDHSNDQLYRLEEFYTARGEDPLQRLYMSKDALKKRLRDHEDEVVAYMKSNRLKATRSDDLLRIINYYNTLEH